MEAATGRGHVYPGEAVRRAMPTEKMEYAEFAREVPRVYSALRLLSLGNVGKFMEDRWLLTCALAQCNLDAD